jgi:RNA polymerase sigma-70 factor (ECF subfamily)
MGMVIRKTEKELKEAFAVLATRYGDAVYTIVRNMCATANEAGEVTHQTFISAYAEIASMPADGTFRTWLFGIAIRTSLAERRRSRVAAARLPQQFEPGNLEVPLREALERMDDGVRAAFVLRDLVDLPASETAAILQTSPREIGLRVHRARLMLISVLNRCFQDLQRNMNGLHP